MFNCPRTKWLSLVAVSFAFAINFFSIKIASAQSTGWVGTTGSWFDAGNWSMLFGTPSSTVGARINNGGTALISAGTAEAKELVLGANSTHSGTLTVSGNGMLDFPTPALTTMTIGDAGIGVLNVTNGGTVGNNYGSVLGAAPSGSGMVSVSGGGFGAGFDFTIGSLGMGSVAITNGGLISARQTFIGKGASSHGSVTVDGPGSQFQDLLPLFVGVDGVGILTVSNGATVISREAGVASFGSGTGTAAIQGAGSRWNNTRLEIGTGGVGELTIADGAVVHVDPYFDGVRKVILGPTGTLNIGAGGLSGTLEVVVVENAGTLNFNHTDDITFSIDITGAGNIFKSGLGTTTLTNVGGATGPIASGGGTLIVQGSVGSSSFGASSGGTLRFDENTVNLGSSGLVRSLAGSAVEYNAAAVNGGFLRGPGVHRIVSNLNSSKFTGVTAFNSVDLVQDSVATFTNFTNGGRLTNNAFLTFDGGTNTSSGVITVNAVLSAADFTTNGVITVNAGGKLEYHFANLVAGGGSRTIVQAGGTIDLLAGSQLDVNGGLLVNNGAINGVVNINYGSLAKGTGAYGLVNVNEGGAYAPGSSPGVSTAAAVEFENGDFSTAAPRLMIELAGTTPGTRYDQLRVTGPLSLAGVLDVALIDGFAPAAGQAFDILDWGSLSGAFTSLNLPSLGAGLAWNTSQLYATGVLSVAPTLEADFDENGVVNGADLTKWKAGFGTAAATHMQGDADGDQDVDGADFLVWQRQVGNATKVASAAEIPEPAVRTLFASALLASAIAGRPVSCRTRGRQRANRVKS